PPSAPAMLDAAAPEFIRSEAEREAVLTHPSAALVEALRTLHGPLVVLGAGGKMGPTLCVRARRAADAAGRRDLRVVAVSRYTDAGARAWLEARGVQTVACDLLDGDLAALPDAANVVYLVGLKFGTRHDPAQTWAVNTLVPARVARRYAGARIAALSTGNVYPLVPVASGGATEETPLTPLGEYANACVARERIFAFEAARTETPVVLLRLNYAVDLRYGVLVDLGRRILAGTRIDLTMGYLNCIWQGDANDTVLRSLALAEIPPRPLNLTGPAVLSVRTLAERLAALLGRTVRFTGTEAPTALLSDPARACALLGPPPTGVETMLRWTARWLLDGGATLSKPTRFEVRDGRY
ncbi:MAG: NAD-dependent epimerase/dehydratase family protein, partial [Rhodothermales bacterium]|nr:NAD-dependent epimerase/dehydratase family protein [Rhodothermales bacterium]